MADDEEILETGLTLDEVRRRYPLRRDDPDEPRPLVTTRFRIEGAELSVAACTKAVGLPPTRWLDHPVTKGRWQPSGRPHVEQPYWLLERVRRPSHEIDRELTELLDLLWPQREAILALATSRGCELSFATSVTLWEDAAICSLGPRTLERLVFFKGEYSLEVFDYRD